MLKIRNNPENWNSKSDLLNYWGWKFSWILNMNSPISWCSPRTSEKFQALNDSEGKETIPSQPAYRINLPVTSSQPPICQIFSPTARFLSTWTSRNSNVVFTDLKKVNVGTSIFFFFGPPLFWRIHVGILGTFWLKKKKRLTVPFPNPFTSWFFVGEATTTSKHGTTWTPLWAFHRRWPIADGIGNLLRQRWVRHARSPGSLCFEEWTEVVHI